MKLNLKLYVALVFLSGLLLGAVGMRFYSARPVSGFNPEDARRRYAEELRSRLKLNPQQSTQLDQILKATHERFKTLRAKYRPEVKEIQEEQSDKIRRILDDGQKSEYEKMREEREKKRRESGRHGPQPRSLGV